MFLDIPEDVSCEELLEVGAAIKIFATDSGACEEFAQEMFDEADEDGDQTVNETELKNIFTKMAEESGVTAEIPDALIETQLAKLDRDNDGAISMEEFLPLA